MARFIFFCPASSRRVTWKPSSLRVEEIALASLTGFLNGAEVYLAFPITRAVLGPSEAVSELVLEMPLDVCPRDDRGPRRRAASRIRRMRFI